MTRTQSCGDVRQHLPGRYGLACLFLSLLLLSPGFPATAQPDDVSYPHPLSLLLDPWKPRASEGVEIHLFRMDPSLFTPGSMLRISLNEALQLAFRNNLDLRAERYTQAIAAEEIRNARGVFDTYLFSNFTHSFSRAGISSAIQSAEEALLETDVSYADLGFRKRFQTGSLLEIKLDFNRFEGNSSWLILNPSYTTHLGFTLAQPLLKNGGITFNTAPIRIAQNMHLITQDQWEVFVTDTLLAVIQAYWDLVFAFQNHQVRESSLDLAKEMVRTSEVQVNLGTLAPVDHLQSQTGVALREEELVSSSNLLLTAEDVLKQFLQIPEAPLYSTVHLIPTETPPPVSDSEELPLETVLRASLKNRPELRAARRDMDTKHLQVRLAANQLLPSVDLTGGVGLTGLGGSTQEITDFNALATLDPVELFLVLLGVRTAPTTTSPWGGGWRRSFEEMFHGETTYQWNVGLRFEMPLENRSAAASYRKAKMETYKALWNVRSLEQRVLLEVRDAWRSVQMNRQKIRTSEATETLAEKQLDAERKRVALGLTSNYLVLQMEHDYRNAQINALMAKAEYWKAQARLLKATGTLLQEEGVDPQTIH